MKKQLLFIGLHNFIVQVLQTKLQDLLELYNINTKWPKYADANVAIANYNFFISPSFLKLRLLNL